MSNWRVKQIPVAGQQPQSRGSSAMFLLRAVPVGNAALWAMQPHMLCLDGQVASLAKPRACAHVSGPALCGRQLPSTFSLVGHVIRVCVCPAVPPARSPEGVPSRCVGGGHTSSVTR